MQPPMNAAAPPWTLQSITLHLHIAAEQFASATAASQPPPPLERPPSDSSAAGSECTMQALRIAARRVAGEALLECSTSGRQPGVLAQACRAFSAAAAQLAPGGEQGRPATPRPAVGLAAQPAAAAAAAAAACASSVGHRLRLCAAVRLIPALPPGADGLTLTAELRGSVGSIAATKLRKVRGRCNLWGVCMLFAVVCARRCTAQCVPACRGLSKHLAFPASSPAQLALRPCPPAGRQDARHRV